MNDRKAAWHPTSSTASHGPWVDWEVLGRQMSVCIIFLSLLTQYILPDPTSSFKNKTTNYQSYLEVAVILWFIIIKICSVFIPFPGRVPKTLGISQVMRVIKVKKTSVLIFTTRFFQTQLNLLMRWVLEKPLDNHSFVAVQSLSCVPLFVTPWLQHTRLPCPSLSPGVSDAIQPSHLLSPSLLALNHFQHQGLFKWVDSLH